MMSAIGEKTPSSSSSVPSSRTTRLGHYEMGRTIGEGTFAKVKFAKNINTGEFVAIKILDKEKVLKHKMFEQVLCNSLIVYTFFLPRFHISQ